MWPGLAAGAAAVGLMAAAPAGVAGPWRLSEVGGKVGCTLNLTEAASIGGFEVKVPAACRLAFPPIKNLATWNLDDKGAMVFSDAGRRRIVALQARPGGLWEGQGPDGGAWRLEKSPAAKPDLTLAPGGGRGR